MPARFVASVLALLLTAATPAAPTTIWSRDLLDDAAVLRQTYEALHPGLYRYNTPAEIDERFAALDAELARDRTLAEAFLAFARFTASIKCGHSYPNFFNQPDAVADRLFKHRDRVPFFFEWLERRMIVTKNFSADPRIVPGSEIVAIDGVPASAILDALLPLARADGSNDAKRIDELGVRGADRYEAFDIYYPLAFPRATAQVELTVRAPDGATFTASVTPQTFAEREKEVADVSVDPRGTQPLWTLRFIDERIAYLRMPTWEVYDSKWDWKAFLADAFAQLARKRPARLIVDLRGNEGGSDVGGVLLAHLIDAPLHADAYRRLVRYRRVPDALRAYLSTWDPSFFDWKTDAKPYDARFWQLASEDAPIEPAAPRFTGALEVLVDAANSSATFNFAQAVQRNRLGTLIGTPTGGNQRGIDGGAFFFVTLPHSHIEVDLPLIGTFADAPMPDAGLTPDVVVPVTPRDVAQGTDPQLQAALKTPR
jgi:hypothetical protein